MVQLREHTPAAAPVVVGHEQGCLQLLPICGCCPPSQLPQPGRTRQKSMMNAAAIYVMLICSALASRLYMVTAERPENPIAVAGAELVDEIG